jgi:hypothetical protein
MQQSIATARQIILSALALAATLVAARSGAADHAWIRVNLIGYLPADPKIAVLSSDAPLVGKFSVGDFTADIGPDQGAWGPFAHNYRLDFSALQTPGHYEVAFDDANGQVKSPSFAIGPDAYAGVPAKLLEFMRLQRCGDNPVTGEKCHQHDAFDADTGEELDMVGGWHDAGDRIKHMITTTYSVAALFLAGQDEEARYGAALVKKIHPKPDAIYVQIGDDRDHLPPEGLWHEDKTDYGRGPGGPRAAWRATGAPAGPKHQNKSTGVASLAGRAAAAMALAGDLDAARSLYQLAKSKPGNAMSVPVRAPYYYGESTYHDDLQWAAAELFIATKDNLLLRDAVEHAHRAGVNPWMGGDRHGHYEFFPYVNLAHWRIYQYVNMATKEQLAGYYRDGLEKINERALKNPYRLGTPLVWCSTNDVVALATQAALYEQMTGDKRYRQLGAEARDWIFGRNPWGMSFLIGVPEGPNASSRPHHLFYKLKNHVPVGGLVDGPVYKDINDGLKYGASFDNDELARFQSDVGVYHNMFADFSTNEPIIDGTVSLLLLLHVWK